MEEYTAFPLLSKHTPGRVQKKTLETLTNLGPRHPPATTKNVNRGSMNLTCNFHREAKTGGGGVFFLGGEDERD